MDSQSKEINIFQFNMCFVFCNDKGSKKIPYHFIDLFYLNANSSSRIYYLFAHHFDNDC